MMDDGFVHWLVNELDDRGWSQRELARRAGISAAAVNQIISEQRLPTAEFCIDIARALRLSPEHVLRKAGYLPPSVGDEPDPHMRAAAERLIEIWNQLKIIDPDSLDTLLNIVVTQAEMVEAAARAARRSDREEKTKTNS